MANAIWLKWVQGGPWMFAHLWKRMLIGFGASQNQIHLVTCLTPHFGPHKSPPIQMTWWLRKCLQQELGALPIRHWTCMVFRAIFFCLFGLFESIWLFSTTPKHHFPAMISKSNRFTVSFRYSDKGEVSQNQHLKITANFILSLMFTFFLRRFLMP